MRAGLYFCSTDLSVTARVVRRAGGSAIRLVAVSLLCFGAIANASAAVTACEDDRPAQQVGAPVVEGGEDNVPSSDGNAVAETQDPQASKPKETEAQATAKAAEAKSSEKKGEWLFAPIPISSPAIGSGLEWAVARLFPFNKRDEVSPASAVGVAGIFTNNGSRGFAMGSKLYLKEDRFRVTAAIAHAKVNFDVYGIGEASGSQGNYIPLNVNGAVVFGEFLYRLKKGIYVGARGQYRNATLSLNQERYDSSDITAQPPERIANVLDQISSQLLHQTTVSLGPRFQWDVRDSVYYPKHGFLAEVASDFFSTGLGSKWSYQYYKVSFNKYTALSEHQVLAFRGMGCAAAGSRVPIYDLCLFGTGNDLRGYTGGRYQDRRMFATQAEYRLMFPFQGFLGRFGVVAFAGVGAIGDKFTNIGTSDLLPAGGGGIRFRLLKKYPINFRVDYGQGKDGHTLSIGVLEAF